MQRVTFVWLPDKYLVSLSTECGLITCQTTKPRILKDENQMVPALKEMTIPTLC